MLHKMVKMLITRNTLEETISQEAIAVESSISSVPHSSRSNNLVEKPCRMAKEPEFSRKQYTR